MQDDEPHANVTSQAYDIRLFAQLLKPSVLSGLICLLVSFFTVAGVVAITNFRGSSLQQDFLGFQRSGQQSQEESNDFSVVQDYNQLNDNFADSDIMRNIPVMVFWMFVGTLVYFVVTGVAGALAGAKELGDELSFVHARRKELLHEVYIKTAIRLGALIIWLLYVMLFFRIIVPYVLAAAHVGGGSFSFRAVPYLLLSFLIAVISLHLHAVMVRLVALRPRLFSQETSF